jgi:hypothetical protein
VASVIGQMTESLTAAAVEALRHLARTIEAQDRRITALEHQA